MWNYDKNIINSNDIEKYNDIYSPYREKTNKLKNKKLIKLLILFIFFVILIIILLLVIMNFVNKKSINDNSLKKIYIKNEKMSPEFNNKVYDYYVLTEKDVIEIKCDINEKKSNIIGCNKKINLDNKVYYIHQIIMSDGTIYKINIKKKEDNAEELISIDSIEGIDKKSNTSIKMKVNASSKSGELTYSIDNGLTYQTENEFIINENKRIFLIVRDKYGNTSPVREININNIDKVVPNFDIEITNSNKDSVTITVFGKDNDNNLLYSFNGGKFSKNNSFEVKESRIIKIQIKDRAGNVSEVKNFSINENDFVSNKKHVVIYHNNGSIINKYYSICSIEKDNCNIILPTITRDGYEILGWSKNKNSINPEYKVNDEINVEKDMDLYAITRKDVSVIFDYNGLGSEQNIIKCKVYGEEKCEVDVPSFTFDKGKIIGWNIYRDSESVLLSSKNKYYTNEDTTFYALAYTNLNLSFDKNGSEYISNTKIKCKVINNNDGCYVNLPLIKKEGAEILGWSTNPNDTQAEYPINKKSLIKNNLKLYAITKTIVDIDFYKNGADSISNNRQSCIFYNKNKSCTINTPIINRKDSKIIGWNTDKKSHSSIYKEKEEISVSENNKYYAITEVPVNISFSKNGATDISFVNYSCLYYNEEHGCLVSTPTIIRNGWNIIGFSKDKNSKVSEINANSSISISKSGTYYAITSKTVTAHFDKNNADSLLGCTKQESSGCQEKCTIYNTSSSCGVKAPYIISKGNEVQLFSSASNNNTLSGYTPGSYIYISSDINLYAIVNNYYRKNTYSIIKSNTYGHVPFEVESGCMQNIYNNYLAFVNRLYKISPYIFEAGKVTFAGKKTFESTWSAGSAGMTYGRVVGYRNVDIICPNKYDRYYLKTIVHELTHAWDSYYKLRYGSYLNSMPDIIALYNKYSKISSSNRPLRDYSYSSKSEFVADMFAWYYFLYLDSTYTPSIIANKSYYPSDMKNVMEKYIKIAKNGYK